MSKPDDIPQDVWDVAVRLATTSDFSDRAGSIASALMAAKEDEREACALLLEHGYERQGLTTKHEKCPHGFYGWEDCESCAIAAIRRGY